MTVSLRPARPARSARPVDPSRPNRSSATARPLRPELHPGAWWCWAIAMAATANRTTNPLLLLPIVMVAGFVVAGCRRGTASRSGFGSFLRLGLLVVAVRTLFHLVFGGVVGGPVLFRLPRVALPGWATGVTLGGPVSMEGLLGTVYDGLRLATMLICVGVAAALASPRRLLDRLPGALYEVGVAVVVGLSLAPQLISSAGRIRRARQLRTGPARTRGPVGRIREWGRTALPVLADATDRALVLAAAMDGRGYGRNRTIPVAERRRTGGLLLLGLCGLLLGLYGLLDDTAPVGLTVAALAGGVGATIGGLALSSRRVHRTHLDRQPWTLADGIVVGSGAVALAASVVAEITGVALDPADLLSLPELPVVPFVGILLAAAAGWAGRP